MKSKDQTAKLKEAMLNALEQHDGNIRVSAREAGISERTHYRWCREDNTYNNAVGSLVDIRIRHAKEMLLDAAMQKIGEGNIPVLNKMLDIFYKNFSDEIRKSNLYNEDPYEPEVMEEMEYYEEEEEGYVEGEEV